MVVSTVAVTIPDSDAPVDTGACDEFDAALGKVSSLTVVHDSAKSKKHGGARLLRKCALVDADGKELCHILVTDNKLDGSKKGAYARYAPPYTSFKAVVQLPDGRAVLTVKNDGTAETHHLRSVNGIMFVGPASQVIDRGDAATIEYGEAHVCCKESCFIDAAKMDLPPLTLTHSGEGAQNVALVPTTAQNATYNICRNARCAFMSLTIPVFPVWLILCCVPMPNQHQHLVGAGTDTAPLGVSVTVKPELVIATASICGPPKSKGPKKTLHFEDNVPLQSRKDVIAMIACDIGNGAVTMDLNQG